MSSPSATATTLQVGTYNYNSDTWTTVLDLNDKASWWLEQGGLTITPPAMMVASGKNVRAQGLNIARIQYDEMHVQASVRTVASSVATVISNVHALLQAIDQPPYFLRIALPGASVYRYARVIMRNHSKLPTDPFLLVQKAQKGIQIDWTCQPGFMRGRTFLQNLQVNPGAENPSQLGTVFFIDPLTNFNAYSVQAGSNPSQDTLRYPDVVNSDKPICQFRFDEASGTVAYDATGNGNNATYTSSSMLGASSLLTGDTDAAITLVAASSQRVTIPTTNLPTGNNVMAVDGLMKFSSNPASTQTLFSYGANTIANHNNLNMSLNSTGHIIVDVGGSTLITSTGALSTGAEHYLGLVWTGTTLGLYVDNNAVQTATPGNQTIPTSSLNCFLGCLIGGTQFFSGTLDEWAIYATALGGARFTAHNTAATTTPASNNNTMSLASGARVAFGSSAWGPMNPWIVPFRWATGLTAQFYLHYTDSNNYLLCQMGSTTFSLISKIGGSSTTVVQNTSVTLVNGAQYFLEVTQFPSVPMLTSNTYSVFKAQVQATIFANQNGAVGPSIVTIGPGNVADLWTYPVGSNSTLNGKPQLAASGAALAIGGFNGGATGTKHSMNGFGPGGWSMISNYSGSATGMCSGAWEQNVGNCYGGGPVTSYGSLRIDCPPAGTVSGAWQGSQTGSAALVQQGAIPAAQGQVFGGACALKANGMSVNANEILGVVEVDTNGTVLVSSGNFFSHVGNTGGVYVAQSGTYTIANASTAYILIYPQVLDNVAGASANGTCFFDNISIWNETTTGQTSMPYCELNLINTPGQLMVSGVVGDMIAKAFLSIGLFYSGGITTNSQVSAILGRRAVPQVSGILVHPAYAYQADSTIVPILDTTAYGGVSIKTTNGGDSSTAFSVTPPQLPQWLQGTFNLLTRAEITGAGTVGAVTMNAVGVTQGGILAGNVTYLTTKPFTANSTQTHVDLGAVAAAPGKFSNLALLTSPDWAGSVGAQMGTTTQTGYGGYLTLMPTDAEVHRWRILNGNVVYSQPWTHTYLDGTNGSITWSMDNTMVMNYNDALVSGTQAWSTSVVPNGDTVPLLNPANGGLNEWVLVAYDQAMNLLPTNVEIIYWPLDEWPG